MSKQDEKNVSELIVEYQPQLKAFIRKRVKSKEDAEDILQDVFYQLVKATEDTLTPIEHIAAWLYRVARNAIINAGVKKKEDEMPTYKGDDDDTDVLDSFSDILFNDTTPSVETEYLRSLVWSELENALLELPVEQREVFELTELEGIPVKDISKATGVSLNTLLSRKHYAVLHLRKRLAELYEEIIRC